MVSCGLYDATSVVAEHRKYVNPYRCDTPMLNNPITSSYLLTDAATSDRKRTLTLTNLSSLICI